MIREPATDSLLRTVRPAFSLVEAVLVTVLIGIFAAVAVPRYANFITGQRADAAARRIAVDLALAQREAKFAGVARTVQFDVAGGRYQLIGIPDPSRPASPYVVRLGDEPYAATIVSANFNGLPTVTFDGYGAPLQSGSVVIRVGSHQRTVPVDLGDLMLGPRRNFGELVIVE